MNMPSVVSQSLVPNLFRASPQDMSFICGAARDEAPNIQAMLPDAFAVVKIAGGILGLLAIGCAVANASRSEGGAGTN